MRRSNELISQPYELDEDTISSGKFQDLILGIEKLYVCAQEYVNVREESTSPELISNIIFFTQKRHAVQYETVTDPGEDVRQRLPLKKIVRFGAGIQCQLDCQKKTTS